jgi:hypothetical protein
MPINEIRKSIKLLCATLTADENNILVDDASITCGDVYIRIDLYYYNGYGKGKWHFSETYQYTTGLNIYDFVVFFIEKFYKETGIKRLCKIDDLLYIKEEDKKLYVKTTKSNGG